jgi:hypothetical protein
MGRRFREVADHERMIRRTLNHARSQSILREIVVRDGGVSGVANVADYSLLRKSGSQGSETLVRALLDVVNSQVKWIGSIPDQSDSGEQAAHDEEDDSDRGSGGNAVGSG